METEISEILETIWHWKDTPKNWFKYIRKHWIEAEYLWIEFPTDEGIQYELSTGGDSINEDIIYIMQENYFLWSLTWFKSTRGGHHTFIVSPEIENFTNNMNLQNHT